MRGSKDVLGLRIVENFGSTLKGFKIKVFLQAPELDLLGLALSLVQQSSQRVLSLPGALLRRLPLELRQEL